MVWLHVWGGRVLGRWMLAQLTLTALGSLGTCFAPWSWGQACQQEEEGRGALEREGGINATIGLYAAYWCPGQGRCFPRAPRAEHGGVSLAGGQKAVSSCIWT